MANWAECEWLVYTDDDNKELEEFHDILYTLFHSESPNYRCEDGDVWFGHLITLLGEDREDYYNRAYLKSFEWLNPEHTFLKVNLESAWTEPTDTRHLIKDLYPSLNLLYWAEDKGTGYYVTNDSSNFFFCKRFYLEIDEEELYFNSLESACQKVTELLGTEVHTVQEIKDAIEVWKEDDSKKWGAFYEFQVTKDEEDNLDFWF